jgi:thiol-disulfide isomerase/thioredoxin
LKRFVLFLIITFSAVCISAQTPLTTAKDFSVKDLEGTTYHLFDILDSNNYVLIDFFTTSCGSCQTYASEVSAAYSDFGCNSGNVVVLGINWGSNNVNVHAFDSVYGAFYPAISGLQGGGNRVVDSFQVLSYPTVILIAPDRQIIEQYIWPPSQQQLDSIIQSHGGLMLPCTVGLGKSNIPDTESQLAVWPNPSQGSVSIGAISGEGMEISIMSSQGQLAGKYPWNDSHGINEFQIKKLSGLSPGLFIVILKQDGTIVGTRKLVVSR